ncbi:hypothetical protein CPB86DRAFT_89799 [Serendipita vermifera]|nr:hypothetical protein CPB86DRAFT_89799 [Serendipita vermifera]
MSTNVPEISGRRNLTIDQETMSKEERILVKSDFDTAMQQEYDHLSKVHPTPNDIPSCFSLFQLMLGCNGENEILALLLDSRHFAVPNLTLRIGIKSQVKSLYRHGAMAECNQKLEDWKFCLSLKMVSPEEKRKAWLEHRARWWAERRTNASSEDVWDIRTEPIQDYPKPPTEFFFDLKTKTFEIRNRDKDATESLNSPL